MSDDELFEAMFDQDPVIGSAARALWEKRHANAPGPAEPRHCAECFEGCAKCEGREQFNDTAPVYKFHVVDQVYEVHPPPNTQPCRFIFLDRDWKFIDAKDSLNYAPLTTRFVFELQWVKGREAHYEVCPHRPRGPNVNL